MLLAGEPRAEASKRLLPNEKADPFMMLRARDLLQLSIID
jgi:hypothetical protein